MARFRFVAVTIGALAASAGCALVKPAPDSPAGTLDRIKATKTITLGYLETAVPFSFVGPDKAPSGYSVELCSRVADDLRRTLALPELQVKWVPVTVESRISAVVNHTIDLECGTTTNTLSRQAQVDFSLTTFITGGSLLSRAGSLPPTELQGVRIAVISGTTIEKILQEANAKAVLSARAQLVPVKDHVEGLAALTGKSADLYASDRAILLGLAVKHPGQFVVMDRYFSYEPYALMLRRGDSAFRLAVNRVLARLYRSGEIGDVYRRWLSPLGAPDALMMTLYAIEGVPE